MTQIDEAREAFLALLEERANTLHHAWIRENLWGRGPWDDEPDRVAWVDGATGLPCEAVRSILGVWCGYVAVPVGHPWHGRDRKYLRADVHGGLTHAGMSPTGEAPEAWWIGFDCGHTFDLHPQMARFVREIVGNDTRFLFTYRDLPYVRAECTKLARQVADASRSPRLVRQADSIK